MKNRQDAWSEENDLLLAETVLRHVREGSTQLNAFEEVGDILNRTSAACGFRWNAVVRHNYEKALQMSRKYRKEQQRISKGDIAKKKLLYSPPTTLVTSDEFITDTTHSDETYHPILEERTEGTVLTLSHVISYLQSLRDIDYRSSSMQTENSTLRKENQSYREKIQELEKKIEKLQEQSSSVQEDYQALINIMNRARKMALLEEETTTSTSFRMDRNGNLERIAE